MAKRILHTISQYPGKTGSGTYLQAIVKEAHKKDIDKQLLPEFPRHVMMWNLEKLRMLVFIL